MTRYTTTAAATVLVLVTLSILAVDADQAGTRWAVLVSGSNGYENYRHQADVCHAYQILKKGGLKDENIVVFMYDDIANSPYNPRPGLIFNKPGGHDVYRGVPKDYVGDEVTAHNFYAVILGNKSKLTGGSRKVVDSRPNDHIFIYYADHGGPGVLGMPFGNDIMANDLNKVLRNKHASGTYQSLVFYLESCESGSIFEGLLDKGLNIYATTASNATESSWATYCDYEEFQTCLGDTYSISWLEDSDKHNSETETLSQQYQRVKKRTAKGNGEGDSSNVMQFGDIKLSVQKLSVYMGADETKPPRNFTLSDDDDDDQHSLLPSSTTVVNQRDADLLHFRNRFRKAPQGSAEKSEARKQLAEVTSHRKHVDNSVEKIWKVLFGVEMGPQMMTAVRATGQPLVDDWDCLKSVVRVFETYCGSLSQYGMKHMRSFANMCNVGVRTEQMAKASAQACPSFPSNRWSSLQRGFST